MVVVVMADGVGEAENEDETEYNKENGFEGLKK